MKIDIRRENRTIVLQEDFVRVWIDVRFALPPREIKQAFVALGYFEHCRLMYQEGLGHPLLIHKSKSFIWKSCLQ